MKLKKEKLSVEKLKMKISRINEMINKTLVRGKEIEGFIERWKDVLEKTDDPFEKMKAKGYIEYYETEFAVLKRRLELLRRLLKFHEFLRILNEKLDLLSRERKITVSGEKLEKMMVQMEEDFMENRIQLENMDDMVESFIREMKE